MIQDIAPLSFDNSYYEPEANEDSYLMCIQDDTILCKVEEGIVFYPQLKELSDECHDRVAELLYLFSIDDHMFFLAKEDCSSFQDADYAYEKMAALRFLQPRWLCFAGVTACQLAAWYAHNQFCGCCKTPLVANHLERKLDCPSCGNGIYPKISPAVIVGIVDNDRILVSKYAVNPTTHRYALIAGFTEIGETVEETVSREVMEEVGLKVKNIRYYKSQPWSLTDTLLLGFFCELDGSDVITLDENELSEAHWATRDELPFKQDDISLTSEMLEVFRMGALG